MAMQPISNVDRVVQILRQRLEERERARRKMRPARREDGDAVGPADSIDALAALSGVDERALRRAFIQTLLADQFGKRLINEAPFQQIVDRVTEAIDSDQTTQHLLSRLLTEVRARSASPSKTPRA